MNTAPDMNGINLMTNGNLSFFLLKKRFKNFLNNYKFLILLLFIIFLSYRLYFWEDIVKHGIHCTLNALADTFVAIISGTVFLALRNRYYQRTFIFYCVSIIVAISFSFLLFFMHYLIYKPFGILNSDFIHFFKAICFQLLDSFSMVGSGMMSIVLIHLQKEKHLLEVNYTRLENAKLHTELKYLKAQMDPHFLFNALNTIYYQISEVNTHAKDSVLQFSDILRYHIYKSNKQKVFLSEEIQYLNAYIDFQELRNLEHIAVKREINVPKNNFQVEPLLLFPLVENAFKHVKTNGKSRGSIHVFAEITGNAFTFRIINTLDTKQSTNTQYSGIGLQNLEKRLQLLYPGQHKLVSEYNLDDNSYLSELILWI